MTLGFSRHMAPKSSTKKRDSLNGLGSLTAFQSHRDYSLTGCSPAEPISASSRSWQGKTCPYFLTMKFSTLLAFRQGGCHPIP
jgi:hypothetical protein